VTLAYRYEAARTDGVIVRGTIEADSSDQAGAVLVERSLHPIELTQVALEGERRPAASRRDLAVVFRGLAALVGAGVPLERALGACEPLARGPLRDAIAAARARLREGHGFAHALADSRGVVSGVVIGMVRAGERGSQLGRALDQVAQHLEQEADLASRVRQALAYPALLAVAGTVSVIVISTTVVPRFAELLGDLGQELPLATRMLLGGSDLLTRFWPVVVGCVVSGALCVTAVLRRPQGRLRADAVLLELPVVGGVRLALATARVARALGGMLAAGMPLLPALDAARDAAGDLALAERLGRARERVAAGAPLAPSLQREGALAPSALQLVAVGESSGRLGEMTQRAGDLAAQEAERGLRTLVTLIEPALIVGFGGVVAFVAMALLQAVYSVRPGGL
jgi:type II secretory pathway component PulF